MLANLIKKILFLAAVLSLSALTSLVKAYEVRDFVFELQGNKAKITNYLGSESTLTIPMYLDGFEVTIIGQNAFNSKGLDSVSFPGSIQIIETRAFANNYLMNINFSDALIEIGDSAFDNNYLVTLNIPSNVKSVGSNAFSANRLKTISYNEEATQVDFSAFQTSTDWMHSWHPGSCQYKYQLINNEAHLFTMGGNCFNMYGNMEYGSGKPLVAIHAIGNTTTPIQIPSNVRYIGKNAFANRGLTQIDLNNVETIADSAFANNNISNLIIPDSVKEIGDKAFFSNNLGSVQLGNSIQTIGASAFQHNTIHTLSIPASVQIIGDYAFKSNYISELNLAQSQADIGVEAFRDNRISQVTIPETIGDVALDAFYGNQFTDVNYLGGGSEFNFIGDSDQDGVFDVADAFPFDASESVDFDSDGIGDNADTDDDGDGHFDLLDAFPLDANEWMDSDSDGIGNNADTDDDNDSVLDEEDAFPYTALESVDTDGDGVGDNSDAFPNDSSETLDTDLDGIGNNADDDDDNDGVVDAEDSYPLNDSIGALESQNLFVMGNPVAVNGYLTTISVGYDVSDANNQLNGIGFRVHYDSSIYNYSAVQNTLGESVVVDGMGPYQDVEDFDNDTTTDSYLVYGWAAMGGNWPNVELPAKLSDIEFFVNWADYDAASTTSNINFTVVDNNEGYDGEVTNYSMNVLPATWDFDGNGSGDALTDGLMLLRYTFGIQDLRMTESAISANATLSATQVVEGMTRALQITDIDGNGSTDALTDGLMLMRYLFGLRGDALILDSVSSDATRTTATDIEQYIALYMPDGLSSPQQSEQSFMVGDWRLASAPEADYTDEIINGTAEWNQTSGTGDHKFSCMADDVYKFGQNGTFSYIHGEGTYAREGITSFYTDADCSVIRSPWDGSFDMYFVVNEDESTIKVVGKGAYIGLPHVANGINEIPEPFFAPDEVIYNYTKISDNEIQLDILGGYFGYRFRLQRVLGN